jgi:hypothetical protein
MLKVFDVWQLKIDSKRAKNNAEERLKAHGSLVAVAADSEYDIESRKRLFEILHSSIVGGILQNSKILEVMAGYGRNVGIFKTFKPKSITIIDILQDHIDKAAKEHSDIEAICLPLHQWVNSNPHEEFDVTIGVWALSYMD